MGRTLEAWRDTGRKDKAGIMVLFALFSFLAGFIAYYISIGPETVVGSRVSDSYTVKAVFLRDGESGYSYVVLRHAGRVLRPERLGGFSEIVELVADVGEDEEMRVDRIESTCRNANRTETFPCDEHGTGRPRVEIHIRNGGDVQSLASTYRDGGLPFAGGTKTTQLHKVR